MATRDKKEPDVHAPGTMVLALIFMAFFIFMILVNFNLLGRAWEIR